MSTNFNGVEDVHNPGSGGSGERKWKSYKLLIDPILKKGQQKLYRYDGVAPGPSGADFSVKIVRDPRSRLSRFWKGREKYDLPVPKFKFDNHYVGELPPKQCTITNLNDNVREAFLHNMCEKFGTIEDINICLHPKTRKHLGLASITFSTTRAAKQAVLELNRTSVMGKIIIVQIDAGGTECERMFDCLVNSSTPSSSSSTPRDPRHGLATPDTPTPRSAGSGDPRRLSTEGKTPLTSEGTPRSIPDHPFAFPEPPPVVYPMGSDQGFAVPPMSATTPGLSGNFAGMNIQDYRGNPPGAFPQDFNRGSIEQYPAHCGNFMPLEHHGMFQRPPLEQRILPPGYRDPNTNMQYPPQMPPLHNMSMQPGFHPGHPNSNYNMYQDSQAWDNQNYGQQGTGDNYGYSNHQHDTQLGYGNQGQPGQWVHQFNRQSSQQDFQAQEHQDPDSSYSHGSSAEKDQSRDDLSDQRSKTKSRNHQTDLPASAEDSNTADTELAIEGTSSTPVQDEEVKEPATEGEEDEAASETSEPNMSLDSRIEALLQRQSGMGFAFEMDSTLNSGQESTSNNAGGEFSPCLSPTSGNSPLLDEGSRKTTLQESSREHSPASHPRYDSVVSKHWETQDTSKSHKSRVDMLHLERQLGHASYKRLQHAREGSTTDGLTAEDSCSRDSATSYKSTPEIRDMDKVSTIPSGASTPTVNENISILNIGSLVNRGLSNLRNTNDQVPSPAISGSPFIEHQESIDESLGSTPVESEPQTSRLLSDTQTEKQVQIKIADALASRNLVGSGSPSDMEVDDDRMSMSSISSGEDTKLEVNVPIPQPNESRTYRARMLTPPPGPPSQCSSGYQWPGVSLPGYSGPFASTGSSNFSPNLGFPDVQSQYPGTNPYAIPPSVNNAPGFPTASVALTASLPNQFMNQWAGLGMTPAQFPSSPQHNTMEMIARFGGFHMPSFNLNQGFSPGQNPFQDQVRMPGLGQANQANQLNQPWPGAIPSTPQFQQFLQQFPQQFQTPPLPNAQSNQNWYSSPPKSDPREELISQLLKTTFIELKKIMKKDLGRKMVESSAFKSLEAWWDDCDRKSKEPLKVATDNEKPSPKVQPSPLMSFALGPRPWNQGSRPWNQGLSQGKNLGLESIGLGLGVRATMPRMPSFKVKRKVPEEEDEEKKPRAETPQLLDEDVSDTEQEKSGKASEKSVQKHRKLLVSDEEDEEEDEEEEEEEEEDADGKISKEVDVEEEEDLEEDDEDEDDEDEESNSDYEDEISSLKSGSESSEDEEEEEEASDMSDSEESSSGSEVSSSEESDSDDEAKDTSRKDLKAFVDSKREDKLAKIPEEEEEQEDKKTEKLKKVPFPEKAVNGDVSLKEAVEDKAEEKKSKTKVFKDLADKTRKDAEKAESEAKPSEKDQEAVTDSKLDKTSPRLNSLEMLVELATKARSQLMEVPNEMETSSEEIEAAGLPQTTSKGLPLLHEAGKLKMVEGSQDAELPEVLESVEEEVVMESVEDMEMQIVAKKANKAALPQEAADDQRPLPFLDHSYCQRPPPSPAKQPLPKESTTKESPPKDIANQVLSNQPTLKLVKLDLSDQELPTPKAKAAVSPAENDDIVDVVSDANVDLTPKKQKSGKRKHKAEPSLLEEEVAIPVPSKPQFMPRNYYEEWGLLYQILAAGVDQEDSYYLRKSYEAMLQEGRIPWLSYTHWVSHSLTTIPDPPKKKRKVGDVRIHGTGAARTEGFYKITTQQKKQYLARLRTLPLDKGENIEDSSVTIKASGGKHMELSREARSDQRRAMATLTRQDGAVSDLLKFNQLKFRKKDLKFLKSGIHGWGLYAMQPISSDEMVIEYVGESIRQSIADERETRYEKTGIGSSYLFRIDADAIIDATKTGNLARFINHSCTPNCYAKIISMESQKKIVIYSKQNISTGEEITYDYKFPIEDEKIPCLCGTTQCRGTLN